MSLYKWLEGMWKPHKARDFNKEKGVFRTALLCNGEIKKVELHLKRLHFEAAQVGLERLFPSLGDLVEGKSGRLKWIIAESGNYISIAPYAHKERPWRITFVPKQTPHFTVKQLNYEARNTLVEKASELGVDECVEIDANGVVLEGAYSNVLWKKNGAWKTPNPDILPLYFGVTIEEFCYHHSVEFVQEHYSALAGSELYLCNSLRGIVRAIIVA